MIYLATAVYHLRMKEIGGEEDKPLHMFVFLFYFIFGNYHVHLQINRHTTTTTTLASNCHNDDK